MPTVKISEKQEAPKRLYSIRDLVKSGHEAFVGASGCKLDSTLEGLSGLFLITFDEVVYAHSFNSTWPVTMPSADIKHFRVDYWTSVIIETQTGGDE